MTTTSPDLISPAIEEADLILSTDGDERKWPKSRQSRAALTWKRDCLAAALAEHTELLRTGITGQYEDEDAAIQAGEETVLEAARALKRALRERRDAEAKAIERARSWFT